MMQLCHLPLTVCNFTKGKIADVDMLPLQEIDAIINTNTSKHCALTYYTHDSQLGQF